LEDNKLSTCEKALTDGISDWRKNVCSLYGGGGGVPSSLQRGSCFPTSSQTPECRTKKFRDKHVLTRK
jgi:hypothetical protein